MIRFSKNIKSILVTGMLFFLPLFGYRRPVVEYKEEPLCVPILPVPYEQKKVIPDILLLESTGEPFVVCLSSQGKVYLSDEWYKCRFARLCGEAITLKGALVKGKKGSSSAVTFKACEIDEEQFYLYLSPKSQEEYASYLESRKRRHLESTVGDTTEGIIPIHAPSLIDLDELD